MRLTPILMLVLLTYSTTASADPTRKFIDDGGTYNADSSNASWAVQNGTLNIGPGSIVLSASSNPSATINMTGGQVNDGINNAGPINISGGSVTVLPSQEYGLDALFDGSTATITGGTFIGGSVTGMGQAGSGVSDTAGNVSGVPYVATLNISGGTFSGGTGAGGYYGGTTGYSLESLGITSVTGGNFLSPIAITTAYGGVTRFFGTNLSFTNGILSGVLKNGDSIDARVYGSYGSVVVNAGRTEVTFSGPGSSGSSPSGSGSSGSSPSGPGSSGSGYSGSGPLGPGSSDSGSSGSNSVIPTPEPSSFLLFGALGAAFAWSRHRRSLARR
ncbi:MAG: PEP-CTERM sorting domain-containing protein [Isosphaeraceae bacterium]